MATETAIGIILQTRSFTETSLIVHWLTPAFGRIATLARGARRPKSPFLGKLDLFYEAAFSFSRSRTGDLHALREVGLRTMHVELRSDISKLRQAAYVVALTREATESETPLPAVFALVQAFLKTLCAQPASRRLIFSFELKLLRELGLEPDWTQSRLAAGTGKIAGHLVNRDFDAGANLRLTDAQNEELRRFLHGFLIFHLGRLPKGRAAALDVAK
jgi:DNA repair protein RecO (recombination protein O)